MDTKLLMKRSMTKKEYQKRMNSRRSVVGQGMKLGTVDHKTPKLYDRKTQKRLNQKLLYEFAKEA